MRCYLIALQFLTIIPLPVSLRCEQEDLGRATAWFPLVGLTIGLMLAGTNWLITHWLAPPLADALLVTLLAAVTGALHLDGLADVCDALAARGSRERFLEVMKDSRVGAVGVVGLVLGLLLKWQALVAVGAGMKWQALLLAPLLARCGQVIAMSGAGHARSDGLGASFISGIGPRQLSAALGTALVVSFLLLPVKGAVAFVCTVLLSLAVRAYFQRRLGGLTGDIVGCISELNEIAVLIVLAHTSP
jgi:adenosylcobinamide-GDP ribazoletransferase